MKRTDYDIINENFKKEYTFALVSDLHGTAIEEILRILQEIRPDYILAPGDIFEPLDGRNDTINENGFALLTACSKMAPTFLSEGNHENGGVHSWSLKWKLSGEKKCVYTEENKKKLKQTGVTYLDNSFVEVDGLRIGGLSSGLVLHKGKPDLSFLEGFCKTDAPKILLCHHPEYYPRYLRDLPLDLIVSGHAHGGQWRFFGQGVFAPGQGIFPRYTSGVHDGKLVIGRGMKPGGRIPRFFNPPEVIAIHVHNKKKD